MKSAQEWLTGLATVFLVVATFFLFRATTDLVTVEREHGALQANKDAVEALFRLQSVMDGMPDTRECMQYVMSIPKEKYKRQENNKEYDYLHDLMNKAQPVPIFNEEPFVAKLKACLGGFFAQHPEAANPDLPKDAFQAMFSDATRTYIRQQIINFANVLDIASSFLLLDQRFYQPEELIQKELKKAKSLSDPAFLIWKQLRGVTDQDARKFFVRWHEGSSDPFYEEFPMCRFVAKSTKNGDDCGVEDPSQ